MTQLGMLEEENHMTLNVVNLFVAAKRTACLTVLQTDGS